MPHTITWRPGMKLSAELFNTADKLMLDAIKQAVLCSTCGSYGLYKSVSPFEISLNIASNIVEVVSCVCHAVTKSGDLIDIDFNSSYNNTFDNRMVLPTTDADETLLLVVRTHSEELREVNDNCSEIKYTFELVGENSPIDDNCLPIAALVNQYGWRMKEDDFVPPCITINAHHRYLDLWRRALDHMSSLNRLCASSYNTVAKTLLSAVWHSAKGATLRLEKEALSLTPAALLAIVQSVVSDFCIGCAMDANITLENGEPFELYSNLPLNHRSVYADIEKGLSLCAEISLKMGKVAMMIEEIPAPPDEVKHETPEPAPAPDKKSKLSKYYIEI